MAAADTHRLELPGDVVQDGREHAVFDREHDRLSVWVPKARKGEHFDGLDMLTRLLARPKDLPPASTAIQELDLPDAQQQQQEQQEQQEEGGSGGERQELVFPHYGFANAFSQFFEALQEDLPEIIDLPDPDVVAAADRAKLREQQEDSKFESEHYMFVSCRHHQHQQKHQQNAMKRGRLWSASKQATQHNVCDVM